MAAHRPFRIAFDASPLIGKRTGVGYYNLQLIEQLAADYPDVTFIGFYYNFLGRHDTQHLPQAPNIGYRPIRLIPNKIVFQLRRWGISPPLELFVKDRVDFVLYGNFWGYPSLRRTPAAPVVHDLTYLDTPEYVAAKNRRDLAHWVPKQIKRSKFVITISDFSKQNIERAYKVRPQDILVTPIPPPTPTKLSPDRQKHLLKEAGVKKPYILFLGTVEPRKNIRALVDAYELLPEHIRQAYGLVLAGGAGWYCDAEIERIRQAKQDGLNITHTGYIDDETKAALYGSAALFVSASHYEGFGMPVLEAMSYGVPCAVSNIQVFREVGGDAAAYFNQNNKLSIAKVISKQLEDKKILKEYGSRGLKKAASYQWSEIAKHIMGRIKKAL